MGNKTPQRDALLTQTQRERLQNRDDKNVQYTRQHRQRIRERIQTGTKDLGVLLEQLEDRDINQVFQPDTNELSELDKITENLIALREKLPDADIDAEKIKGKIEDLESDIEGVEKQILRIEEDKTNKNEEAMQDLVYEQEKLESRLAQLEDNNQSVAQRLHEICEQIAQLHTELQEIEQDSFPQSLQKKVNQLSEDMKHAVDLSEVKLKNNSAQRNSGPDEIEQLANTLTSVTETAEQTREAVKSEVNAQENQIRDELSKAIAFYLHVANQVDLPIEQLIEDAIVETYNKKQTRHVVGDVSVQIKAEPLQTAAQRASEKLGESRLTSTELRAFALTEHEQLGLASEPVVTEAELEQIVLSNPELIEQGLEILDVQPQRPDGGATPDLVGKDRQGRIVVVELASELSDVNRQESVRQLRRYIDEYGGEERVQGVLVAPETEIGQIEVEHANGNISIIGLSSDKLLQT